MFDIVADKHLKDSDLSGLDALVLPNTACLSQSQADAILGYVSNGGGLVATYQSSLCDESGGRRKNFALAAAFGVDYVEGADEWFNPVLDRKSVGGYFRVGGNHEITRGFTVTDFLAVTSPVLKTRPAAGTDPLEKLWMNQKKSYGMPCFAYDYPFLSLNPPEESEFAMITARNYGKGRVVYVAADLGSIYAVAGDPYAKHLLANAVRWVSRTDSPVKIEAPACIELTVFRQPAENRLILHLVNSQSVPKRRIELSGSAGNILTEDILPVINIEMMIRFAEGETIKDVYLAPDREPVPYSTENRWIKLQVPELHIHRMVVVEFG